MVLLGSRLPWRHRQGDGLTLSESVAAYRDWIAETPVSFIVKNWGWREKAYRNCLARLLNPD